MPAALDCAPGNRNFYLGNPQGKVVQLLIPDSGFTATLDQGRVDHQLLSGYHFVQRGRKFKRSYGLALSALGVDSADQIMSILYGLLGPGPYFFVDPFWRNVLSSHVSSAGGAGQTSTGFVPSAGAVAYSGTVTPPTAAPLSGVQVWTGAGNGSTLWVAASSAQVLERSALPAYTMLPVTFSVWAKTATSTASLAIDAYFNTATGAYVSSVNLATGLSVTTGWTRYSGTLATASIPATAYLTGVAVRCLTAAAPAIHIAALGAQFATGSVSGTGASALPPWVLGLSVPRMLLSGTAPANAAGVWWRRNTALTLVEAA